MTKSSSKSTRNLNKRIYLDYASITPIDPRVSKVVEEYSSGMYANPSSWYKEGVLAKKVLDDSRKIVSGFIGAHADEVIFTSGGTESNNIALQGVAKTAMKYLSSRKFSKKDVVQPHIIISSIEHSSIIETTRYLQDQGCEVTKIPVDVNGVIDLDILKKSIKPNTILVSIMTVNNEVGTIQPIREISKIIRQARAKFGHTESDTSIYYPLFHTDAAQAGLFQNLNVEQLGVDFLTLDAGKLYGPRGIGALYVRRRLWDDVAPTEAVHKLLISPIIFGGGQERGLRSGTENISAIAGFAKALEIIGKERQPEVSSKISTKEVVRILKLKRFLITGLKKIRKDILINGVQDVSQVSSTSPFILNISIPGIDNEFLVIQLDATGIACSTKSSCLRDEDESYGVEAIGADSANSIRFSFGRWTTERDILFTLKKLKTLLVEDKLPLA